MSEEREGRASGARPGGRQVGQVPSAAAYAGVGLQFAITLLVCLFLGRWLDQRLGTAPWLLMAGVFLGAAAGIYSMYRKLVPGPNRGGSAPRGSDSDRERGR